MLWVVVGGAKRASTVLSGRRVGVVHIYIGVYNFDSLLGMVQSTNDPIYTTYINHHNIKYIYYTPLVGIIQLCPGTIPLSRMVGKKCNQ